MATHSSILAWEIPWTEEPGGLQFLRSQRVRHDCVTAHTHTHSLPLSHTHTLSVYNLSQYESFSYVCLSQCVCVFVTLSVHG